jgi:hypothetical protein
MVSNYCTEVGTQINTDTQTFIDSNSNIIITIPPGSHKYRILGISTIYYDKPVPYIKDKFGFHEEPPQKEAIDYPNENLKDEKKRLTHERDQIQRKYPRDNRLININRRLKEIDKQLKSVK